MTNVDIGNVSGFSDFDKDSNAISVKNSNIWSGSDISIKELEEPLMISYKKPGNNTDNIVVNNPRTYVMIDQLCASYNSGSGKIQEFLGWSEKENGGVEDIKYHFGDMVYVAKNITLYPVFEEISNNNAKNAPGTSRNPYVINNINDWNMILVSNAYTNTTNNNYVTYFQLGDDITLDNTAIVVTKFNGVLDGNNHKITLNNSKIPFIEINGTIRNLNVVSNSVQTYTYNDTTFASCLAVYLNGGIIENVKVSGRLQTSAQVIGSIVAHAYSGYINNSTSSVEMELVNIDSNKTTFGGLVGTSGYIRNNSGENKGEIFDIVEGSPMFGNGTYLTSATASKGIKFALVIDHSYFIDGRELQENDPNRGLTIRYLNATDGVVTDGGNVPSIQGGLLGSSTQHVLIKNINTSNNFVKFYRNGGSTGGLMGMNREGVTRFKDCNYNNTDINVEGGSYYGNYLGHGNQGSTFNEFINCVNSANIRSSTSNFGGIVGKGSCVYFESVINYGTISTNVKTTNVGGLIGYIIDGGFYIKDSTWDTSSNPTNNEISAERFGGLVGRFNGGSTNSSYNKTESYWYRSGITNSNVNATIIGSVTSFGGFVGYIDSSSGTTIDSCNESIVVFNGSANVIGGLIGQTTSATIKNSSTQSNFTNVTLTGSNPAFGGLIGKSAGTVSISECNVLAGNNTISLKADNPLYVGGFVGYTSGAVSSITISGSKFNTPLTLDIPVTSYIGGAVGYTNRTDITVEESTIIELQTYTVSNSALVTEYYGGVVAYFYNKDNTIGNSDWLKVKNSTIAIKNTIDSSNGKRGLIAGYVEVPTYVVETKDDKTGQINRTTYYRYTISGNTIYYTGNARIMGNVSSLAEHSTYYTNNTQSDYQSV